MATMDAFDGSPKDFSLMDRHLVVVGQSGSGKSSSIGKIVEELATKTRARIVILDRAGDFVKLQIAAPEKEEASTETETSKEEVSSAESETLREAEVFSEWNDRYLPLRGTRWSKSDDKREDVKFRRLALHPSWFDPLDLCAAFGFPLEPAYWGPLATAQRSIPLGDGTYDFLGLAKALTRLASQEEAASTADQGSNLVIQQLDGVDQLTERLFSRIHRNDLDLRDMNSRGFRRL